MASEIQNISQRIRLIGVSAKNTGNRLSDYERAFDNQVEEVLREIGGSAANADKQVIATLERARRELRDTVYALQDAGKILQQYGDSLA